MMSEKAGHGGADTTKPPEVGRGESRKMRWEPFEKKNGATKAK